MADGPRGREYVQGGTHRWRGPHDALSPDGKARSSARHDHHYQISPTEQVTERPTSLAIHSRPPISIGEAADRVLSKLPPDLSHVTIADLESHRAWFDSIGETVPSGGGAHTGAFLVVRRRLLDLVRAELIESWESSPPRATAMVECLQQIERARESCVPDEEQTFAAELTDIGGLDLVVEVAHDMRSPLTSILFLAEILHREQSGALNDVQKRQIGIVYSAALGLVGMASDMIEVARGGNRLQSKSPVTFSVNEMLQSIHALVSPFAEQKGVALVVRELQADIRQGFPVPLSRILVNLATNAMKFTHEGEVEVSAVSIGGMRVEFAVRDSGPGIPPEALDTLYQPFRRESTRKSGYIFSGTGLGLAICQRLIKALGSELVLETAPGKGTRFSFVLQLPPANIF